jgi:hypothetical protein
MMQLLELIARKYKMQYLLLTCIKGAYSLLLLLRWSDFFPFPGQRM